MRKLNSELIRQCKQRLIEAKTDLMNRVRDGRQNLVTDEKGGDEGDQTMRILAESEFLNNQERLRRQLVEIEMALARIQAGSYGVCEETEEIIEVERLLAIPWTRLSIEGAEMREAVNKRYHRQ
jgi:DnaK suppressor protein